MTARTTRSKHYKAFLAMHPNQQSAYLGLTYNSEKLQQFVQGAKNSKANCSNYSDAELEQAVKVAAIFDNNAFVIHRSISRSHSKVEEGVFIQLTRINHSCRPNTAHHWDEQAQEAMIYASVDIRADEELTISFVDLLQGRDKRQQRLQQRYGFACTCVACDLSTDFGVKSMQERAKMERLDDLRLAPGAIKSLVSVEYYTKLLALVKEEGLVGWHEGRLHVELSDLYKANGRYAETMIKKRKALERAVYAFGEGGAKTRQQREELAKLDG